MMNRRLQSVLLRFYKAFLKTGVFSTQWGRAIFEWSYDQYKEHLEAGHIDVLRGFVKPATTVIDVGANIGFFTKRFGRWVSAGGRVIAIEPEQANFSSLERAVLKGGLGAVVDAIQGVAAEAGGTLQLELNPFQHSDHKIGERGIPVKAFSLDEIMEQRGWPSVSLCKIDVQGAEERVLRGAVKTLRKFHPALFVEVGDSCLRGMGSSAESLFALLADFGYQPRILEKGRLSEPLALERARDLCRGAGYRDFLFLQQSDFFEDDRLKDREKPRSNPG